MRKRLPRDCHLLFALLLGFIGLGRAQSIPPATSTTAYRNGFWFDGSRFVPRTAYVVGQTLSFRTPKRVNATIDLHGGYVVPPFGEAHNHNVEPLADVPKLIATYLEHGIFYVKNPNNLPRDRSALTSLLNKPDSIDVTFANGGWTSSRGHPTEIAKRLLDSHRWTEDDGESGFYWTADTPAEVEKKWPQFLEQKPEFVKVYLLFSEDSKRQSEPERYFAWKGVTPEVLRAIADRAHSARLRVSAHIESAHDFHEALVAGVDEINHMPGFRIAGDVDSHAIGEFELSDADAELAHRLGTIVVTTLVGATKLDDTRRAEQDALNARNLRRLLAHHVSIALGSDSYRQDTLPEALYLASLHAFDNTTVLKMWTEMTAATIYPSRRIGQLREGYEASFLVLAGNPLEDFSNVTRITRRVKQGHALP
jgi:amidohydrolase family protein